MKKNTMKAKLVAMRLHGVALVAIALAVVVSSKPTVVDEYSDGTAVIQRALTPEKIAAKKKLIDEFEAKWRAPLGKKNANKRHTSTSEATRSVTTLRATTASLRTSTAANGDDDGGEEATDVNIEEDPIIVKLFLKSLREKEAGVKRPSAKQQVTNVKCPTVGECSYELFDVDLSLT